MHSCVCITRAEFIKTMRTVPLVFLCLFEHHLYIWVHIYALQPIWCACAWQCSGSCLCLGDCKNATHFLLALVWERPSDLILQCIELIWCSLTPWLRTQGHMAQLATVWATGRNSAELEVQRSGEHDDDCYSLSNSKRLAQKKQEWHFASEESHSQPLLPWLSHFWLTLIKAAISLAFNLLHLSSFSYHRINGYIPDIWVHLCGCDCLCGHPLSLSNTLWLTRSE